MGVVEADHRYCGLCRTQKTKIAGGILICPHCDTTIGCPSGRCGGCEMVRKKTYVNDD